MSERITCREIVKEWLEAHNFQGLCQSSCGCGIEDLAPCTGEGMEDCTPAYKFTCPHCKEVMWGRKQSESDELECPECGGQF